METIRVGMNMDVITQSYLCFRAYWKLMTVRLLVKANLSLENPTLEEKVKMKIPSGTQSGKVFRLRGKGVSDVRGYTRGDQLVRVVVETPTKLSSKQKQLLKEFADSGGGFTPTINSFIEKIKGAGNSSTILSYSGIDKNPYRGISYYRLKQTDFDGQFEYSQIRSVNIDELMDSQIQIYPNPAENQINIIGDVSELKQLKIYNTLGQDVTGLIVIINKSDTSLIIDLSNLRKGMYWIKTKTTANKVYKQ